MRIFAIILGFALVSYSTVVCAFDYRDPTDAAYCVGSLRRQYETTKLLMTSATEADARRAAELKLSERQTFVEGSIKQGALFDTVASRMIDNGYADADLCTKTNSKCTLEHIGRLQNNVDKASSEADFDDCIRPIIATCNRIQKCDG